MAVRTRSRAGVSRRNDDALQLQGVDESHEINIPIDPEHDWRVFAPELDDSGRAYGELAKAVMTSSRTLEELRRIANERGPGAGIDALRTRAAALVLHDLVSMGWGARVSQHYIEIRPPVGDKADTKQAIRRQLEFGRDDQLKEPSTRRFIAGLERPGRASRLRPVTDLIADGRELARKLAPIADLPKDQRGNALASVCQPYLQLVEADAVDDATGHRLMDIWRYFRHSWATRYRTSPGRNLFYILRDAAQPNHPVMGIAALGNTVIQLTPRDVRLGWTLEGLEALLSAGQISAGELLTAFRSRLIEDIEQIYTADLPIPADLSHGVSAEVLDQLKVIEDQSAESRAQDLRDPSTPKPGSSRVDNPEAEDLALLAQTPLFRGKRARAARDILRALGHLQSVTSFDELLSEDDGRWAIQQVIRQLKKQFAAASMMEITVCGAVAPYSHVLGGKLVCMMMLSPRVVSDYAHRYADEASIIASQMAGRVIKKPASLVFLGTTSLYTQRSSQYNRVRIPCGALPGQTAEIAYEDFGTSKGFGSPNLSAETEAALERLSEQIREFRNVNFVFGEGQSPKLRRLRESFDALGLTRANLLHHSSSRIVYGVPLATNCVRFLLGLDPEPRYALDPSVTTDEDVANYWRTRWLASRLDFRPALDALKASSPLSLRVSRLMPVSPHGSQPDLFESPTSPKERGMPQPPKDDDKIAFLRNLYRNESAYSDDVRIGRLKELNVKTPLDDVIRRVVRAGASVVITGNAGDGKTHTIRLLEKALLEANAEVVVDASEFTHDAVLAKWVKARDEGRPFCIAINEGPLIDLIRAHKSSQPWLEGIQQQLFDLVRYTPVEDEESASFTPEPGVTYVVDLSLRRTLSRDLLERVILKLTDDTWFNGCANCPGAKACPVTYNRTMLRKQQVIERLTSLLVKVSERGVRATFRQVLGFTSFLIFGGRSCSELLNEANSEQNKYYWNAFEGQGEIFDSLARGLDPIRQTSPKVDDDLWNARVPAESFLGHTEFPVSTRNFDAMKEHEGAAAIAGFTAIKRRWYFEHTDGRIGLVSPAEDMFSQLLDGKLTPQLRVGRLIALINSWWNASDSDQQDRLRLWTRLAYSPRAHGKAMVSGREVQGLKLHLFRPTLAPILEAAFGEAVIDHLVLAPRTQTRFARLVVDRRLIEALLSHGSTDDERTVHRQLSQFNDALARHADEGSHVRTVQLLDPTSELDVRIRVDLSQRRYDSAQ